MKFVVITMIDVTQFVGNMNNDESIKWLSSVTVHLSWARKQVPSVRRTGLTKLLCFLCFTPLGTTQSVFREEAEGEMRARDWTGREEGVATSDIRKRTEN